MSAQQPLASSRGQRSTRDRQVGRQRSADRDRARRRTAPRRPDVRRCRGPSSGALRADRRTHRLGREQLRIRAAGAAIPRSAPWMSSISDGHAGLGGALSPADAGQLRRRLDAAAVVHRSRCRPRRRCPPPRSRSATATGRSPGTTALLDSPLAHRPDHRLEVRLVARHAPFDELEEAGEFLEGDQLRARGAPSAIRAVSSRARQHEEPGRHAPRTAVGPRSSSGISCRSAGYRIVSPYRRMVATGAEPKPPRLATATRRSPPPPPSPCPCFRARTYSR